MSKAIQSRVESRGGEVKSRREERKETPSNRGKERKNKGKNIKSREEEMSRSYEGQTFQGIACHNYLRELKAYALHLKVGAKELPWKKKKGSGIHRSFT